MASPPLSWVLHIKVSFGWLHRHYVATPIPSCVVRTVALDGAPDSHAGNHDFITFRRGMECATCKKEVRIWCNTCLVCHTCFCASPRPCGEVVLNVVDDVCDEGENNSADDLATPRKPDKGRGVARMQAKLVMAAQKGRLRDWTKGALLNCLDVLGVKVAGDGNRRQMRDLAMQQPLPLLAHHCRWCHALISGTWS